VQFQGREELLEGADEGLEDLRADALAILERAVERVDPELLLGRSLRLDRGVLTVRGDPFAGGPGSNEDLVLDVRDVRAVRVVAAGKAAEGMLRGLERVLEPDEGFAVSPQAAHGRLPRIVGGHPLPDAGSCKAGERALQLARATGEHDLLLVLLGGGASALLEDPLVPLEDLRALNEAMIEAGAAIEELNLVRKKLSGVKGGRLAQAARGQVLGLLLSDCFEDHEGLVGSGPTAPDATTHADALAVLKQLGVADRAPASVLEVLREGAEGKRAETPKPGDPAFARVRNVVVGSNALAAHEATEWAVEMGYHAWRVREPLREPAARAGWKLARMAEDVTLGKAPLPRPACIVYGGETFVDARGTTGLGGRNQEMALGALEALRVEACIACLGTDGKDGPTDAAGAIVDMGRKERAEALGVDPRAALRNHDSHGFFARVGGLLRTGPTGTNVADLAVLLVP
jgi:hydroxypyruvate reductase